MVATIETVDDSRRYILVRQNEKTGKSYALGAYAMPHGNALAFREAQTPCRGLLDLLVDVTGKVPTWDEPLPKINLVLGWGGLRDDQLYLAWLKAEGHSVASSDDGTDTVNGADIWEDAVAFCLQYQAWDRFMLSRATAARTRY